MVDSERKWSVWTLTEGDIRHIAAKKGLSLVGKDLDEIADLVKTGIDSALETIWEEIITEAIQRA